MLLYYKGGADMARKFNKTKKSDFITVPAVVKSLFSYVGVRLNDNT